MTAVRHSSLDNAVTRQAAGRYVGDLSGVNCRSPQEGGISAAQPWLRRWRIRRSRCAACRWCSGAQGGRSRRRRRRLRHGRTMSHRAAHCEPRQQATTIAVFRPRMRLPTLAADRPEGRTARFGDPPPPDIEFEMYLRGRSGPPEAPPPWTAVGHVEGVKLADRGLASMARPAAPR